MATIKDECPVCKKLGLGKPLPAPFDAGRFTIEKRTIRSCKYCRSVTHHTANQQEGQ